MNTYKRVGLVTVAVFILVALLSIFTPVFQVVPYLDKGILLVLAIVSLVLFNKKSVKEEYRYTTGPSREKADKK